MEIKVGQVWFDADHWGDTVLITKIIDDRVSFSVLEDPNRVWGERTQHMLEKQIILDYYKLLKGYGTPLWNAINSPKDSNKANNGD